MVVTSPLPTATNPNPLLLGQGLPPFDQIEASQVVPGMQQLLATLNGELAALEASVVPTWEGLVEPVERFGERLRWSWGIVGHLMGVKNSPELREAYQAVQPDVIGFSNRLGQSKPLYEAFVALKDGPTWSHLSAPQQRIVTTAIQQAELAGVSLSGDQQARFNEIQLALGELATQFGNHVLDATQAFHLDLTSVDEVAGLPPSLLGLAAQAARAAGETNATPEAGPWRITLDFPSFGPFLKYSERRDLREVVYRAYIQRAAAGDLDNTPIIRQILQLRREKAALLGYESFAALSLASKMAPSVEAVTTLLEELRAASFEAAGQDLETLQAFATSQGETEPLKHWDISFWSERLRQDSFALNEEALRSYFPLPQVLEGLFGLVKRLFGATVSAADGEAPVWHPDVRYFQITNEQGEKIANFFLDPYSRPAEKRGGAWMDDCLGRDRHPETGALQLPVAYLICNQTPPVDGQPSLMTFREVETLFHEFGHGLQHMLTTVDYPSAAGINNVEWDAVELPSQFMENWCYDRTTLMGMARHYQTGESLPEAEYQKLLAARTFMSGSGMLRQVHLSLVDIVLHHDYDPQGDKTPNQVRDEVALTTSVLPPLPEDSFLCSFGHIFAGGYAAGYYSYKWAEVLSADAFAAFEEAGLEDEVAIATTGRRFRDTVLALGGGQHPLEVFGAFRGRAPHTEALLRHSGLRAA